MLPFHFLRQSHRRVCRAYRYRRRSPRGGRTLAAARPGHTTGTDRGTCLKKYALAIMMRHSQGVLNNKNNEHHQPTV